jgi:hypothetical protein
LSEAIPPRYGFAVLDSALKQLATKPINLSFRGEDGLTLLMKMCQVWTSASLEKDPTPQIDIVLLLMTRRDVELQDSQGRALLNHCIAERVSDLQPQQQQQVARVAIQAIKHGADLNHRDPASGMPLLLRYTAHPAYPMQLIAVLLRSGADPSQFSLMRHYVLGALQMPTVAAFSPDLADANGNAFLHVLISTNGDEHRFQELMTHGFLSHGFDIFHRNNAGFTAGEVARQQSKSGIAAVLGEFQARWDSTIRLALTKYLATDECTWLPTELVDLTLQYIDGHGRPFQHAQKKEDRGGEDVEKKE